MMALGVAPDNISEVALLPDLMMTEYVPHLFVSIAHISGVDTLSLDCFILPPSVFIVPPGVHPSYGHTVNDSIELLQQVANVTSVPSLALAFTLRARLYEPENPDPGNVRIGNYSPFMPCKPNSRQQSRPPASVSGLNITGFENIPWHHQRLNDLKSCTATVPFRVIHFSTLPPTSDDSDIEAVSAAVPPNGNEAISPATEPGTSAEPKPRKRQKRCTERQEEIDQALAKMIAINQMPLAFTTSTGFRHFMGVVEPSYESPSITKLKNRIKLLHIQLREKVVSQIDSATTAALPSDCWTSRVQDSYITVTAQTLESEWKSQAFT
ncbi:hypothetical protein HPB49_010299 [Dermacentor silvarum]|uniref:Uncharacterized protein n=1 Tax=Dermacentor silvarum TaxID=543639 RepID=A0ACB8CWQ9_DERSI|nr:hypothetical protein HPB49_010299 [Dermacentor silvarum]